MVKLVGWLLVPLLPLMWLVGGTWLMPTSNILWEHQFDSDVAINGLGFIDDGKVLLLSKIGRGPTGKGIDTKLRGLIGLNTHNGEQVFEKPLLQELLDVYIDSDSARLSTDGTTILLNYCLPGDSGQSTFSHLLIYDWRKQEIIKRYRTPTDNYHLDKPISRGSTLAVMSKHAVYRLLLWHGEDKDPLVLPISEREFTFGLSEDGEMAHACMTETIPYLLVLIDVKKGGKVQTIDGVFREVRWSVDHQSFIALKYDPTTQQNVFWSYRRVKDSYVADQNCGAAVANPCQSLANRPYITLTTFGLFDPWRSRLTGWLGTRGKFITDRLWPEGPLVQLHDVQTGRLIHQFHYPLQIHGEPFPHPGIPFPHPDGQYMALCNWGIVLYWDLVPFSRWYPLIGLAIGILLSTLLAWKLLRHTPKATKGSLPRNLLGKDNSLPDVV